MIDYRDTVFDLFESARQHVSDIKPSVWAESHRVMSSEISQYPGPFSYDRTPYTREIVDNFSPDSAMRIMAVMKGGQIGLSAGVIENGIGWIIDQAPGPTLFLSGHEELSEEMMNTRIDQMIESCGLRGKIRPNVIKRKNQRTGDTAKLKEFRGGYLLAGAAGNPKLLRQRSVRYGFIDDFDGVRQGTNQAGSTTSLIEQRFAAYYDRMKLAYISTPELESTSNIKQVFLKGDQRYYNVPCPRCHEHIPILWEVDISGTDGREKAGITWRLDNHGLLIPGSVGYICQKCGKFFTDQTKYQMNLDGFWVPKCEGSEAGYFSYHISSLYAPPGMYDWEHYVRKYLAANPPNAPRVELDHQAFVNLCLGETYEKQGEAPKANDLQKNQRAYAAGVIPESVSVADGNGKIIMVTCAADLNGKVEDARLDYEILAWSESGASYSIKHGSIGTFVLAESRRKDRKDRAHWTYHFSGERSVWTEFTKVRLAELPTDTGRKMKIMCTALDCGQFSTQAYAYIDNTVPLILGVKGRDDTKFSRFVADYTPFKISQERNNLYLIEVNRYKDDIAARMRLPWSTLDERQPPEFMNFPAAVGEQYTYQNYFSHYEAEHRVEHKEKGEMKWMKKNSAVYNHMFDCRVYNNALRDIITDMLLREHKIKGGTWRDLVNFILRKN